MNSFNVRLHKEGYKSITLNTVIMLEYMAFRVNQDGITKKQIAESTGMSDMLVINMIAKFTKIDCGLIRRTNDGHNPAKYCPTYELLVLSRAEFSSPNEEYKSKNLLTNIDKLRKEKYNLEQKLLKINEISNI